MSRVPYRLRYAALGLFRKGETCIIAKFHWIDLVMFSHSREEKKTKSYSQINTVLGPELQIMTLYNDCYLHTSQYQRSTVCRALHGV